jgi:nickel superoxide dismutase
MKNLVSPKIMLPVFIVSLVIISSMAHSHCQIPCGIYDDSARFQQISEHIATIEKSMKQVNELSQQQKPSMNQIVRWVVNKEEHADLLSEIVTYYFMAQRIKPAGKADVEAYQKYVEKLTLLHEMLVYSMQAKQTTDLSNVETLKTLSDKFKAAYFADTEHKH